MNPRPIGMLEWVLTFTVLMTDVPCAISRAPSGRLRGRPNPVGMNVSSSRWTMSIPAFAVVVSQGRTRQFRFTPFVNFVATAVARW